MARHEIRYEVLLLLMSLVDGVETLLEGFQQLDRRLMHTVVDFSDECSGAIFRWPEDVVPAELFKVVGSID